MTTNGYPAEGDAVRSTGRHSAESEGSAMQGLGQSTQHLGLTFASGFALALMTAAGAVHYAFGRPTGSGAGSAPNAPKSEQGNPESTSYEAYLLMNMISLAMSVAILMVDLTISMTRGARIIKYSTFFRNTILYIALVMGMGACLMLSFNTYSVKKPLGKGITIAGAIIAIAIYAGMFFVLIIDFCYPDWPWCTGVDIEGEVRHPAVVDIEGKIVHPAMDGEAGQNADDVDI
ncbi:hypothetical protein LXL04_009921 [Taraxacum kok-saghyz]